MLRLFKLSTLSFVAFMACHEANTLLAQTQASPSLQRAQQVTGQVAGQQSRTSPQLSDLMNLRRYSKYRFNALGQRVKAKQPNPFTWALGKSTSNSIAPGSVTLGSIGTGLNDMGSATLPTLSSALSSNTPSIGTLNTGALNTTSIGAGLVPSDLMSA